MKVIKASIKNQPKNRATDSKWRNVRDKLKLYNLTLDQYHSLYENQDFCCKICGNETKLVIDHDHKTGKVRGLLCRHCNTGIGMFSDNTEKLKEAIKYIEDYQ